MSLGFRSAGFRVLDLGLGLLLCGILDIQGWALVVRILLLLASPYGGGSGA